MREFGTWTGVHVGDLNEVLLRTPANDGTTFGKWVVALHEVLGRFNRLPGLILLDVSSSSRDIVRLIEVWADQYSQRRFTPYALQTDFAKRHKFDNRSLHDPAIAQQLAIEGDQWSVWAVSVLPSA